MKKLIVAFIAALAVNAVNVYAEESVEAQFKALDTDNSGSISAEEAAAQPDLAAVFKELDTDGNGELSLEEFEAFFG
ncbi:EF-hand domain-containing protein [Hahella sp. SMD15-11]|uniref:EF-hand domain-containing protein n=1 Tax=Thermohahella caldifontis TaxID=3142973 RepID=A0AB39UUC7_9GAMM